MKFKINIDYNGTLDNIKRQEARMKDMTPVMRSVAGIMGDAVEENFENEGRAPFKWKKLSPVTVALREKMNKSSNPILQLSGDLAGSVTQDYGAHHAGVGTNKRYAAIHNYGGMAGKNRKVRIPKRPFLRITQKEYEEIKAKIRKFVLDK